MVSERRHQAAEKMSAEIESELADLRMERAKFAVDFQITPDESGLPLPDGTRAAFDASGYEQIEFLVAPNPGEGLKPLVKVASGGETSRLMLALKNVLARADHTPTLIFDEIDQGIGGRVGAVVGEKLWKLGREHQVLCITHLAQLAGFRRAAYPGGEGTGGRSHHHSRTARSPARTGSSSWPRCWARSARARCNLPMRSCRGWRK